MVLLLLQEGSTTSACELVFVPTSLVFKCSGNLKDITTFICDVTWARFLLGEGWW